MLRVLNDYPSVGLADGVQIQLGDAYAGQRLRLVFELPCRSWLRSVR